jgi:nucleoside-diphosphate-sugar epimerase
MATRVLVIGGTRFIGPHLLRALIGGGHDVTVFHRGRTCLDSTPEVRSVHGDRSNLADFRGEFRRLRPDLVIDMIAYAERNAAALVRTFKGVAQRVVMISSMDVYRAYDRLRRIDPSAPDPLPLTEESPLRSNLYPYREKAADENDFAYSYEKILVERAAQDDPDLPATVLRLPAVYGPGDYQHRAFAHAKRMDDRRPAILLDEAHARWRWTRGYVENVAAAIALAAADPRAAGRVYNVGDEPVMSEAEWVRALGRAAGWHGRVVPVPRAELPPHLAEDLDWTHHLAADTTRIRTELGFKEPVPLAEALGRTVEWERHHPPATVDPAMFDYTLEDAVLVAQAGGKEVEL